MSFRQSFRAVPIRVGERYKKKRRGEKRRTAAAYLGAAALVGAIAGVGSAAAGPAEFAYLSAAAKKLAVSTGLARARSPQIGDYWSRCDAARAAGTAPIYLGEPGYRQGLDADGDGVACERYRGM